MIDLSKVNIQCPYQPGKFEKKAIALLQQEIEKRTTILIPFSQNQSQDCQSIIFEIANQQMETAILEGFCISTTINGHHSIIKVTGNSPRGLFYGVGYLLRKLILRRNVIILQDALNIASTPKTAIRGHQLGYRDVNNTVDGWDFPDWEQYIRDLVIFGTNEIELIPPGPDDRIESPHFPRSREQMMVAISTIANDYDLNVGLWWPYAHEGDSIVADSSTAISLWNAVFSSLPRLDDLFVPGGDPGNIPPKDLFKFMAKQAEVLWQSHPNAKLWVSPQQFCDEWMTDFFDILQTERPTWLHGIAYGPWDNYPIDQFRALIPDSYQIRLYPDITHNLDCQFPVQDWDIAYALTEARESVNPRPIAQQKIINYATPFTVGYVTYSDGCHDDVNKIIWSGLGWDSQTSVEEILHDYARYFIGDAYTQSFSQGILALERNWIGPISVNKGILATLLQFQDMEKKASPFTLRNWRFLLALYRAYYDAYIQSRSIFETALEEEALSILRDARRIGAQNAIDEATKVLNKALNQPINAGWRTRIYQLAEALFQSIHLQLSVKFYQAPEEVRGANLDGLDYPLNNRVWLMSQFDKFSHLKEEAEKIRCIDEITQWENPGPGGFYDCFGLVCQSNRVIQGLEYEKDPNFLLSPMKRYPYRKDPNPMRLSWRGSIGTMQDTPLEIQYQGLDPKSDYRLQVIYSNQALEIKISLCSKDTIIHPFIDKPNPPEKLEFKISRTLIQDGKMNLMWKREPGKGGTGTGCEVCEIWLIREDEFSK